MAIGTLTAIGIAASAAGSIGGAALASRGASAQASAAERASSEAVAEQRRQFDITQQNLQPWLQTGTQALQLLQYLMGLGMPPGQAAHVTQQVTGISRPQLDHTLARIRAMGRPMIGGEAPLFELDETAFEPSDISTTGTTPGSAIPAGYGTGDFGSLMRDFSESDFQADPGYAFRLKEGFKALERSAAARGTVLSGGTLRELARYNQDFASNEFSNAFNRFQENRRTRYNQLASLAGLGQQTGIELGRAGAQNAQSISNLIVGGQTAAAAARASGYNAWANALQNASNLPLNWWLMSHLPQTPVGRS
jgi:hypothetical protein